MSWSIMDCMRLMFQRDQELELKELQVDTFSLVELTQGGGTPIRDNPSRAPSSSASQVGWISSIPHVK
jgi:hypothetical protein